MNERFDVVVIGGGSAGLSGALTLGRARRSVLVIDSGSPRNAPASGVHNYLGREGAPPAALLADGRREMRQYGGTLLSATVTTITPETGGGFRVVLDSGDVVRARRVLVASGAVDNLPDIPGLAERWGTTVVHCPYCHGWEVRDQAIGVLGAPHQALLWRQWSADITLFTHTAAAPTADEMVQLAARGITVVDGEVAALEDKGVRLADGTLVAVQALAVATRVVARLDFLSALGLEPVEGDTGTYLAADPMGATSVPGIWVAGNAANPFEQVIGGAAAGARAAAAINADLIAEDTRLAVSAASNA